MVVIVDTRAVRAPTMESLCLKENCSVSKNAIAWQQRTDPIIFGSCRIPFHALMRTDRGVSARESLCVVWMDELQCLPERKVCVVLVKVNRGTHLSINNNNTHKHSRVVYHLVN